jgi:hypothetical protein
MRLIARKGKFACAFLTVILSGSLFTGVVFANDEPKTVPARDEQPKKLDAAKTETGRQSDSDASETSAPQAQTSCSSGAARSVISWLRIPWAYSTHRGTRHGSRISAREGSLVRISSTQG